MKFVVNRVHKNSIHEESDVQGSKVVFNNTLTSTGGNFSGNEGWAEGYFVRNGKIEYCHSFTIAEIDDDGNLL